MIVKESEVGNSEGERVGNSEEGEDDNSGGQQGS